MYDCYKERALVHTEGDFHIGLQTYIFTIDDRGTVKILMVKRTVQVDISKTKYDQIAIQVLQEDEKDVSRALSRGISDELGIQEQSLTFFCVDDVQIKIVKHYEEDSNIYNREYIKLFFTYIPYSLIKDISPNPLKIAEIQWLKFIEYAKQIKLNPDKFTKTACFYVTNDEFYKVTECFLNSIASAGSTIQESCCLPTQLQRIESYFFSDGTMVSVSQYKNAVLKSIAIYKGLKIIETINNVLMFHIQDTKYQQTVNLTAILSTRYICIYREGKKTLRSLVSEDEKTLFDTVLNIIQYEMKLKQNLTLLDEDGQTINENSIKKITYINYLQAIEYYITKIFDMHLSKKVSFFNTNYKRKIVTLPGTFDPLSVAHITVLLQAIDRIIEESQSPCYIRAGVVPLGDDALGFDGTVWKKTKKSLQERLLSCKPIKDIFSPLINIFDLGLFSKKKYGIELCGDIAEQFYSKDHVDLYLVSDSDTFNKWKDQFYEYTTKTLQKEKINIKFLVQKNIFSNSDDTYKSDDFDIKMLAPMHPEIHSTCIRKKKLHNFTFLSKELFYRIYHEEISCNS